MRKTGLLAALLAGLPFAANACGLALALAVDTSLSVDAREYQLQMGGIADALGDSQVQQKLLEVPGGVSISLMQWSGRADQAISLPWQTATTPTQITAIADIIATTPRVFATETAPGSAIFKTIQSFRDLRCDRQVIDISGDGIENSGTRTRDARDLALAQGITINGLVILGEEPRLETFYRHNVIGGPGSFLQIAQGFDDYARAIREKLLREIPLMVAKLP